MRILVVEDDPKIAKFLANGLEAESHVVDVARDGHQAIERATSGRYDLVLLDLNLPGVDGLDVLRSVRTVDAHLPIIAITARAGVEDRVQGLDHGADDYLTKPFSFVELSARIRALFRRSEQPLTRVLRIGDLSLDRLTRTVSRGSSEQELSAREFQLLEAFLRQPDEPLTRAMLADRVWGHDFDTGTNVVDVYINYVRRKLRSLGLEPIKTLRGVGYVLETAACAAESPT